MDLGVLQRQAWSARWMSIFF